MFFFFAVTLLVDETYQVFAHRLDMVCAYILDAVAAQSNVRWLRRSHVIYQRSRYKVGALRANII